MTTAANSAPVKDSYRWIALANTTAATFMSALDGSIILIALPAIFAGIHLDPLDPGNIGYLLWMIMGYRVVQAVLVVTVGKLGDQFGRVKIYNAGFIVFTLASVALSFDPFRAGQAAIWLIAWRVVQALGGSMLSANGAAILTDAFPAAQRGFALGVNSVAALAGQFIGLTLGGLLAIWDWRAVFWVNVPVGIFGTIWSLTKLREPKKGPRPTKVRMDWWGNTTFAVGLTLVLIGITEVLHPYNGHAMGWTNPVVLAELGGGIALLIAFCIIERRVVDPMFDLNLFKIRAFWAGNVAGFLSSMARGGMQFILIIWLQGIWLPMHGYEYDQTPLWAGIFLLPMTLGFLIAGPTSGALSDRYGSRGIATSGMLLTAGTMFALAFVPVDFPYWVFAALIFLNGLASGMFASPNSASIMGSVPPENRGVASGMRVTALNAGTALSIGVFFSLMVAGLSAKLPTTLTNGLVAQGVDPSVAADIGNQPAVGSLFGAILGVDPIRQALGHPVPGLSHEEQNAFFPQLISGPLHSGLIIVFVTGGVLCLIGAFVSALRGAGTPAHPATHEQSEQSGEDTAESAGRTI